MEQKYFKNTNVEKERKSKQLISVSLTLRYIRRRYDVIHVANEINVCIVNYKSFNTFKTGILTPGFNDKSITNMIYSNRTATTDLETLLFVQICTNSKLKLY